MGDMAVPERRDGRHAGVQVRTGAAARVAQSAVPAMPRIRSSDQDPGMPHPFRDTVSPTIGWRFRPPSKGGPVFSIIRRGSLGGLKVVEDYPLTEEGWLRAWQSFVKQNPAAVPVILEALEDRRTAAARPMIDAAVNELEAHSQATMRSVAYLGGYVPEAAIIPGQRYDVRFLIDRLLVVPANQAQVLAEVHYSQVEVVDIGGPGLVRTGGGFVGGGFGATGAIEGMAVAAVLNALTTRTSIKTIVRIQATTCELFLLHTKVTWRVTRAMSAAHSSRFPAPELPCWSLIGRIGHGRPFEVGTSILITATTGRLYLGVNDNSFSANTGIWAVNIKIGGLP
jgi:hypothetical protein